MPCLRTVVVNLVGTVGPRLLATITLLFAKVQ